ncbi:hypothetical protein MUB13_30810 [Pseudomonas aeruginosa]|nr:hypothetical protein [Pseudomonas aeruginosa]MCJ1953258.1 hypothetical protein [Pseudomonas aeruginosa]MDG3617610.1 hypothetical protein [Pseudomonas aeruginosa]
MRCLEKKGLLTMSSQLIGMLAASTQGDADAKSLQTGAWVAGNATQHNYLSHWQEEKKRQEVDGCKDKQLCKTGIEAKWAIISAQQDVGIVVGVGGGIGLSTAETAVGVYELVKNWRETYAALEQLATSPEFRQQFGDNYLKGLEERAAFLTQAYEDAGWQGSVTAGVEGGRFAAELVGVLTAVKGGAQITAKLPTAAKNLVNAIAESPVSGSMSSQLGAVGDLGRLGGGAKGTTPTVTAEGRIGNSVFTDVNQTARPAAQANPNQPTLIADRVDAKIAANGKPHPNGNMADAHAEIGVIQQAYNAGKTTGADMALKVEGKAVCSYCRGDIAAAAEKAGLNSLQINEVTTGKTLYWKPGMRSLRELE